MDHLALFVLERQRYAARLRDAELGRLARARGAVDDRPGRERPPRWPRARVAVRVARRVNRSLPAVR